MIESNKEYSIKDIDFKKNQQQIIKKKTKIKRDEYKELTIEHKELRMPLCCSFLNFCQS